MYFTVDQITVRSPEPADNLPEFPRFVVMEVARPDGSSMKVPLLVAEAEVLRQALDALIKRSV